MNLLAVTVVGDDRPGIIAAVTGALEGVGGNLEDTSMTLLRGHFAMMLIVACERTPADVEAALAPVAERLGIVITVRAVSAAPTAAFGPDATHHLLSLHGADRPGIVARVSGLVAAHGGNITDLTTRLVGDLYTLVLELDLPPAADPTELGAELAELAGALGVVAHLHPADADVL